MVDRNETVTPLQLYRLAGSYYEVRDYEKTLATAGMLERQVARDSGTDGADFAEFPDILRGHVHLDRGEYGKALKAAVDAKAALNRPGAKSNNLLNFKLINIEGVQGIANALLGRDEEAGRNIESLQSIESFLSGVGPEKSLTIARVRMALKQFPQALEAVRKTDAKVSVAPALYADRPFHELPVFFILAKSLYETGRVPDAKERYNQLLRHPQVRHMDGLYWPILLDRARIALAEGQAGDAEKFLREAVDVVEKPRAVLTDAGRTGYAGDRQTAFGELVKLLINSGRAAEAFEYVERAKSRALVDLLAAQEGIPAHARKGRTAGKTLGGLARAERDLEIIREPGVPDREGPDMDVLKKNLRADAPEFASLVTVTPVPVREVQERLAINETLVEYYSCGREWFVFVLKHDSIAVRKLGELDIEKDVAEFRAALADPSSLNYKRISQSLCAKLVLPAAALIGQGRITVVPHGPLHYLSFGALSNGRRFILDEAALRVLPYAGVLKHIQARTAARKPAALVMGNPDAGDAKYNLKFARDEARSIAGMMRRSKLLLDDKAKASYFAGKASSFNTVHLAARGILDPDDPLGSALLLARDTSGDGRLRVVDLFCLNLKADLVTVSACETANGKISGGDDVVGFTRGILYAGASSVVSSLWKVDDRSTKELMIKFYSNLKKMDKDEALRQAQLQTRKKYPHPFHWAAFQLTGSAR
jgi:CHAT domain-containing protein